MEGEYYLEVIGRWIELNRGRGGTQGCIQDPSDDIGHDRVALRPSQERAPHVEDFPFFAAPVPERNEHGRAA